MESRVKLFSRVVEVICDRGEHLGGERWFAGTGTLIGGRYVLTCAHVVDSDVPTKLKIRTIDGAEHAASLELISPVEHGLDLAILVLSDVDMPYTKTAGIDRTSPNPIYGCWAVGFPRYSGQVTAQAHARQYQQTAQVWGYILPGSRLRGGRQMEFTVTTSPGQPPTSWDSPWAGMSGAGVFVTDSQQQPRLIGVLSEHMVAAGPSVLTVVPLSSVRELDDADEWTRALGPLSAEELNSTLVGRLVTLSPDLFTQPLIEAVFRTSTAVVPAGTTTSAQAMVRSEPDDRQGDRRSALAYELLARACEISATPDTEAERPAEGLATLLQSPHVATLLDQLLRRTLQGSYDSEAQILLRSTFANVCEILGVLPDKDTQREIFDSISAWIAVLTDRLTPLPEAERFMPVYAADALRDQAATLARYVEERKASDVGAVLEHLRSHVHQASARISLMMLGQNRSLPLDAIYVEPRLTLERRPAEAQGSEAGVPETVPVDDAHFGVQARSLFSRLLKHIGDNLLDAATGPSGSPLHQMAGNRSIVLGQPGVGKSTLSTKLSYDGSGRDRCREPVPFVVTLRDLVSERERSAISIVEFMEKNARTDMQIGSFSVDVLRYFLLGGSIHVIFDGLDEITDPANYDWATQAIDSFCLEYKAARVTITSRQHGFDGSRFPTFTIYSLAPFNENQLATYVKRWFTLDDSLPFSERERYARDFIDQSRAADELRRIPLLLALMCSIFAVEGNIPSTLSEIYQKCAQLYFNDWDSRRRIRATESITRLPSSIIFEAFSALASSMLREDSETRSGVTKIQLTTILRDFFKGRQILDEAEETSVAEAFAAFVAGRAWLVDKVGRNDQGAVLYQFTHRTFLEYFAAEHVVRTLKDSGQLAEFGLSAFVAEGQVVVAQLAFQICGRTRPDDVATAVMTMIKVVSYTPLQHRVVAVRFFITLLSAVPLGRASVAAIVSFCISTVASLGHAGSIGVWTSNGYPMHESTDWFEYRSLGQAVDFKVDEPGDLLCQLLITGMKGIVSRGVLMEALRAAMRSLTFHRPDLAVVVGAALNFILSEKRELDFNAPEAKALRELGRDVLNEISLNIEQEARENPSLAIMAALKGVISFADLVSWHGLSVLMLEPLNPLCEVDYSLGEIAVTRVLSKAAGSERETEILELVFRRVREGIDVNRDLISYRAMSSVRSTYQPQESADPTPEAVSGAIALLMITGAFNDASRIVMPGHEKFPHEFLQSWNSQKSKDPSVMLRAELPQECIATLASLAEQLRESPPLPERLEFKGVSGPVPRLEDFFVARESPYWLSESEAVGSSRAAPLHVASMRRLSSLRFPPYVYGLGHMLYVSGCQATDQIEAEALLRESIFWQIEADHSEADLSLAHSAHARALCRVKSWRDAEQAALDAITMFTNVREAAHMDGGSIHDIAVDIGRIVVALSARRAIRSTNSRLVLSWIRALGRRPDVDPATIWATLLAEAVDRRDRRLRRRIAQEFDLYLPGIED